MDTVVGPKGSSEAADAIARVPEAGAVVAGEAGFGPAVFVSKLIDLNSTMLRFNCLTIDGVLTVRRARLLWTLASLDYAPCLTELTELDNAGSTQNCGRILSQLDEHGFLEVRPDSLDGRMLRVYISDEGCEAAERFVLFANAFGKLIEREVGEVDMETVVKILDAFETIIASSFMSGHTSDPGVASTG